MGVFKKLTGADVRVTPIQVKTSIVTATQYTATNKNPEEGDVALRGDFITGDGINNPALLYNSIRQLFYGAFISRDFLSNESIFSTPLEENPTVYKEGVFSRFDPSFQGSLSYNRDLPITYDDTITVGNISRNKTGESLIPGTVSVTGATDDSSGNLVDTNGNIVGNVFYDQGIIVRLDGGDAKVSGGGSYTIYATQYKCTANPHEFNYSLNPTLLSGSNTQYDLNIVDSPEFMPYVTTIGLYNENQELMIVAKLAQPVKLNPYTDTNFIVRIDK